ncbi:MAG TPA: type II toxin-antitoxin system HicA family toxin [Pyrinomonadaceae bacterium]|nr:type II toxin-antitoxin system HicA family toxin [Pyrinomonadaceae bacterium]
MASLRPLPYRVVKRKLENAGFEERMAKGSHRKFVKLVSEGVITAIVPEHREIAVGTLRSIIRQAMLTLEEFEKL